MDSRNRILELLSRLQESGHAYIDSERKKIEELTERIKWIRKEIEKLPKNISKEFLEDLERSEIRLKHYKADLEDLEAREKVRDEAFSKILSESDYYLSRLTQDEINEIISKLEAGLPESKRRT